MTLYRATPKDGIAWVTGASSGIGRSVALDLAGDGYTVAATARTEEKLAELCAEAESLPGRIIAFAGDVTDEKAMADTVAAIEDQAGPIVLVVLNAGKYFATRGERLESINIVRTYEVNLFGLVYCLVPAVEHMRERGRGQIAIIGSVSGYFGWPSTAAYGSSKAALNNMAESLKYDFDRMNIRLQVINPGFVDTPLTAKNPYQMPALMDAEAAAERIVAALRTGGFQTDFPRRFTWFLKLLRACPQPVRFWFVNKVTRWGKRPVPTGRKQRPPRPS